MLIELRQYRCRPGQRARWVEFMDREIIPFQSSKGMVIMGSFTAEEDDDLYVWIRRFDDEAQRKEQYAAVYESDEWKESFVPRVLELIIREEIKVTRLNPTPGSVLR